MDEYVNGKYVTETFGERLKRFRKAAGLTQLELGKRCGMADSAVRRLENSDSNPTRKTIQRLAKGLGIEVYKLQYPERVQQENEGKETASSMNFADYKKLYESQLTNLVKIPPCDLGTRTLAEDLLESFVKLNYAGQAKAVVYVQELSELKKYQKEDGDIIEQSNE